jgi:cytochrome c
VPSAKAISSNGIQRRPIRERLRFNASSEMDRLNVKAKFIIAEKMPLRIQMTMPAPNSEPELLYQYVRRRVRVSCRLLPELPHI